MTDFWTTLDGLWNGSFWSGWVMAIVVINYGSILFLFLWAPWTSIPHEKDGTTGHAWADGAIREGLHKLPKWWLIISSITFVIAFVYLVLYPGFGSRSGAHGWTSFEQMQNGLAANKQEMQPLLTRIKDTPILELSKDTEAMHYGARLFDDNCAACHGYDAKGGVVVGAPDLVDNTWEYGGSVKQVLQTIKAGRNGVMPAWGSALGYGKVKNVANYVLSLSGAPHDAGAASVGKPIFGKYCSVCHGADGTGNQMLGAPDLADNVWKWGAGIDNVMHTIQYGRQGHMPSWSDRLNSSEIRVLAAWVLSHDNDKEAITAEAK